METTTLIFPSSQEEVEYTAEEVLKALAYLKIEEFTGANGDKVTYQKMPHGIFISTPSETSLSNPDLEESISIHIAAVCYDFFGDCGCGEYEESDQEPCDDIFCDEKEGTEDPEADTASFADALAKVLEAIDEENASCSACSDEDVDSLTGEYGLYDSDAGIASHSFIEEIDHIDLFVNDEWYEAGTSWCDDAYRFIQAFINARLPEGFWIDENFLVNYEVPQDEVLYTRAEVKMVFVAAVWTALRVDNAAYFLSLQVENHLKQKAAESS